MNPRPRDSLVIIRDILQVAARRASKTEIVYRSNINFVAAERYISRLLLRGMLETVVEEGKSKFQTTLLGMEALSKLTEIQRLFEGA
ncbi:DNA-binding protein [Candidatus Bathyarchaeota archaeon]|nr:MAG: DNA-binding protein [Candidatus Bathyarchaeota archaeon]TMI52032.1 MAG: DNA-binding protein [Candidatus Bathyarchaeota archaeon]